MADDPYERLKALAERGRLLRAIAAHEQLVIEPEPDPEPALVREPETDEAIIGRTRWLLNHGSYAPALVAIEPLVSRAPDNGLVAYLHGRGLFALGRLVEARASFDRACSLQPMLLEAQLFRGEVDRSIKLVRATVGVQPPMDRGVPPRTEQLLDSWFMDKPGRVGRILAVGGGKGGVGKSLVSTNLAVALAKSGASVVMLDADLGAPNLHTMFGIMRPQRTVEDFLAGRSATLDEVALPTSIPGLRLICGAEGALGSAHPTFENKQKLLDQLGKLSVDCLLIDVGAGVDLDTIDFFNAADTRIVVMVPEITSLQNGYAFLKIALFRRLQRASAGLRASEKIAAAFGKDAFEIGSTMDKVSTFFTMLEDEVPELVASFRMLLDEFNAVLVGNMLHKAADRNALFAMQRMIAERLSITVDVAAALGHNPAVRASVNDGRPFATTAPHGDPNMREINQLAQRLLAQDLSRQRKIREEFVRTMKKRPIDPNLHARFEFGLEGIARSTAPVAEPKPVVVEEPAPQFTSEFRQLQRVSERIKLYLPIELDFDGRGYLGQLIEINEGGGNISGIRAPAGWQGKRGTLKVIGDASFTAVGVVMHSSQAATGNLIVVFEDDAVAKRLVAELRKRVTT